MKDIYTLAIETSCDETSAAVVKNGREIISSEIFTQVDLHREFGGVVPEIASRNHLLKINEIVSKAMAGLSFEDIDQVAVTYGPGLVGALLVGVSYAKGLSYSLGKPLVGVHHLQGHIAANYLAFPELEPPFLALAVSGGHTHLIEVLSYTEFRLLGRTKDDAAGEAYDKIARRLGLGYPGGPLVEQKAREGQALIEFPIPQMDGLDFSFSGLKSAVLNYINKQEMQGKELNIADICASFQKTVVEMLATKVEKAIISTGYKTFVLAGGVAANQGLRARISAISDRLGVKFYYPPLSLCTDNAAMIAAQGFYNYQAGKKSDLALNAQPMIPIDAN